jgi:hypothetical protein
VLSIYCSRRFSVNGTSIQNLNAMILFLGVEWLDVCESRRTENHFLKTASRVACAIDSSISEFGREAQHIFRSLRECAATLLTQNAQAHLSAWRCFIKTRAG